MKQFWWVRLIAVASTSFALALPLTAADSSAKKSKTESETSRSTTAGKIDINTAELTTLQTLPGIGPQTAKAIVAARPFASVDDLEKVPGIGAAKMTELRSRVTASKVASTTKKKEPVASSGTTKEKAASSSAKSTSDTGSKAATAKSTAPKVDINSADATTLETLPGVGAQTAKAIMAARPFASVDDLERVPGIGPSRMETLRDRVTASQKKVVAAKDRTSAGKSSASTARSSPTVAPSSPAATAPGETGARPLEPTGRIDTARSGSAQPRTATSTDRAQERVNINTATLQELEALPEIGPVKAQAIIDARPFSSVEDVMRVKGVKEETFNAIKEKITVR